MYRINAEVAPDEDWELSFVANNVVNDAPVPRNLTGAIIFAKLRRADDTVIVVASTETNGYIAISDATHGKFDLAIPNSALGGLTIGQVITADFILRSGGINALLFQLVVKCAS